MYVYIATGSEMNLQEYNSIYTKKNCVLQQIIPFSIAGGSFSASQQFLNSLLLGMFAAFEGKKKTNDTTKRRKKQKTGYPLTVRIFRLYLILQKKKTAFHVAMLAYQRAVHPQHR